MTVSNTDLPVKIYAGTATEYPIPFDYISDNDILVTLYNTTTGAATDQTIDVDYTIVEETVMYSEEPGAEYNVVIRRVTEFTQEASFGPGEEPPLSTHESAFDKLTMLAQDLDERLSRCVIFPDSHSGEDFTLPDLTTNAGRLLRINEDGTGLDVLAVGDSGQVTEVTDYCDTADLEELHDIISYGALEDWVDVRGYNNSISAALDAIGDVDAILYVAGGVSLDTDTTIPENIRLKIRYPGAITLGNYNLILNGPFDGSPGCFVYTGIGSVSFGPSAVDSVNPSWFGVSASATGLNNQTCLTRAIAACAAGGVLKFFPGTYTVAGQWTINKGCEIDLNGATLYFSTNDTNQGVIVTTSNVEIYNGTINGPQYAALNTSQVGIYAYGVDASNYISGLNLHDLEISGWGYSGITSEFIEKFNIERVHAYDIVYAGIQIRSSQDGSVINNKVHDIDSGNVCLNSYGIVCTKGEGSEAVKPVCKRINVHHNHVWNVKHWEGLDTHGGEQISFVGNQVTNCYTGIMVGVYESDTHGAYAAPKRCLITHNVVYTDNAIIALADTYVGIILHGNDSGMGLAEDNVACNNTVSGFKEGFYIRNDRNTTAMGNTISKVYQGFYLGGESLNICVSGNAICDIDATSGITGIHVRRNNSVTYPNASSGIISGNAISAGSKPGITAYDSLSGCDLLFDNNHIVTTGMSYTGGADGSILSTANFNKIIGYYLGRTTIDFASIAAGSSAAQVVSVPGLTGYGVVSVSLDRPLGGLSLQAYPGTDHITIELYNHTSAAINLASSYFFIKVDVLKI